MAGQAVGVMTPQIEKAARQIMGEGWRVTSILRPGSKAHAGGIALDAAPMTAHIGGFGWQTARAVLEAALRAVPNAGWVAVSEDDHVHLELTPDGGRYTGVLHPNRSLEVRDMVTGQMFERPGLPAGPIGDPFESGEPEFGDFDSEDGDAFEDGDPAIFVPEEIGDIIDGAGIEGGDPLDEFGDAMDEYGAPVPFKGRGGRVIPIRRMVRRFKRMGKPIRRHIAMRAPALYHRVRRSAMLQKQNTSSSVPYVAYAGAQLIASSVGWKARLRRTEALLAATGIYQLRGGIQPSVIPFSVVGPNLVLDFGTVINALGYPVGSTYSLYGLVVTISSSVLNVPLGLPFSVTFNDGPGNPQIMVQTLEWDRARQINLIQFIGTLSGGFPRVRPVNVVSVAAPAGQDIVISGVPIATTTAQARLFVPGDRLTEQVLQRLTGGVA